MGSDVALHVDQAPLHLRVRPGLVERGQQPSKPGRREGGFDRFGVGLADLRGGGRDRQGPQGGDGLGGGEGQVVLGHRVRPPRTAQRLTGARVQAAGEQRLHLLLEDRPVGLEAELREAGAAQRPGASPRSA